MDNMTKLFAKKKKQGKELDPIEKAAKMSVVGDMKDYASEEMSKRLSGFKPKSKAKEGSSEEEAAESPAFEAKEDPEGADETEASEPSADEAGEEDYSKMSKEELDEKIKQMQEALAHK